MQKLLPLAILLALPALASASNEACLVSFAGAQQNVCDGTASTIPSGLGNLTSLNAVSDSSLRLVKFDGPIQPEQRRAIEAAGARVIGYVPYNAFIVRMAPALDANVRAIAGVTWTGPFMPALKVDPNIYAELKAGGIVDRLGIESLEVSLDTHATDAQVKSSFASITGLKSASINTVGGNMRLHAGFARASLASTIEQLAARDDVLAISFRKPVRLYNSQGHWLHQSNVNTPQPQMPVWDRGIYGCGQIVGELDTGLWMDNVAFKDASQPLPINKCTTGVTCPPIAAPNYNARKVVAYYKWSDLSGTSWGDDHGHGTHVAGSIIGNDNVANPGTDCVGFTTPGGNTNLDGMAPGAKLVMQESGGNLAYLNTQGGTPYHAADIAYQNGARIHSNSWGGGCTDMFGNCVSGCTVTYDQQAQDADQVLRDRNDLLMVFAAGNDATACPNGNNVGSPGNAKNVLTIGATGRGTGGNAMAGFSSRGPTLDARTKPDITAQGSGIISADRSANGTLSMSGTSMATPTAAGLAALVRDYLARGFYPSGVATPADSIATPSGALVKAILTAGAFKMTGNGAGANPSQSQGFGRILLDDSLYFDADQRRLFIEDNGDGLQTGEQHSYSLDVTAGQVFTVALTWTDVAGAVNASPATVNSLRLEVQAPNGDVWTQKLPAGYTVDNATPTQSTATSNYDDLNTLHRIRFDAPVAGTYEIRVRGINVPTGPQTYAVAATGDFVVVTEPDFGLSASPNTLAVCAGTPGQLDVGVRSLFGFVDPVTLSVSGLPGATTGSFASNPVVPAYPAAISALSIDNTAAVARGSYPFTIHGATSGTTPRSHDTGASLKVSVGIPVGPVPSAPADTAVDVARTPSFAWSSDVAADAYSIEVATDAGFTSIVASGTPASNTWAPSSPLAPMTTYYWHVKGTSVCGDGNYSPTFSFTTGVTFPEPYCTVTFPSAVEPITRVKFSGINNTSPADVNGSPALEDFLGVTGGDVVIGQSYSMAVEGNTAGSYTTVVNAFIDWNRDGTFGTGESYTIGNITNSTGADGQQAVASIAVPLSATPGPVRMRVLKRYSSAATACNNSGYGQGEDYTLTVLGAGATYTIGGNVSGTTGAGLALKLNGGADFAVAADGAYTFPNALPDGSSYTVTVSTAPAGQSCSVAGGTGTVSGANVTNVNISCVTVPTYTIGGMVNGLTGTGLVLRLNGGNDLTVAAAGSFTFSQGLADGSNYTVTVATQPSGQTCSVANGAGTLSGANVTGVQVDCADIPPQAYPVGGMVSGMMGPGLILQLNGGLTLTRGNNGAYAFTPGLPDGATYNVTVHTAPTGQSCSVSNGSGTMGAAPVTNADVVCVAATPEIFADGFEGNP
ncbi:MAG TPA: S8 family serine peptidase [Chiayiivirga sp.]|nr:S8 family serine peptidase [Chiayiivirga sp.]